jgi:hypothetical protein
MFLLTFFAWWNAREFQKAKGLRGDGQCPLGSGGAWRFRALCFFLAVLI